MLIIEKVYRGVAREKMINVRGYEISLFAFLMSASVAFFALALSGFTWYYAAIGVAPLCFSIYVERKEPRAYRHMYLRLLTLAHSGFGAMLRLRSSTRAPLSVARGDRRGRCIP